MLSQEIVELIVEEQVAQDGMFIKNISLPVYMKKLSDNSEIVAIYGENRCKGFVAFYCNNLITLQAYIPLVLVNPLDRNKGIGKAIVKSALAIMETRSFNLCQLEVNPTNIYGMAVYKSLGFYQINDSESAMMLLEKKL